MLTPNAEMPAALPEPLVPGDIDLRDFPDMMLDVRRLLQSETWIAAAEIPKIGHASMCLWCEAFHQVPASSLPDNDIVLARLAMCTRAQWDKLRPSILHGWIKCSDGRIYHPVVAEKAMLAWSKRTTLSRRGKAGAVAKHSKEAARLLLKQNLSRPEADLEQDPSSAKAVLNSGKGEEKGEEKRKEGKTADGGSGGYAFAGRVVRLSGEHLADWQKAYHAIPDLRAELTSLDAYYDTELKGKDRANWFIRCSTALSKKHQEWTARHAAETAGPSVGRAWA